jgi:hypothetical protein
LQDTPDSSIKNEPGPDPGVQMDEGHFVMCAWILKEKLQEDPDSDVAQKKILARNKVPDLSDPEP